MFGEYYYLFLASLSSHSHGNVLGVYKAKGDGYASTHVSVKFLKNTTQSPTMIDILCLYLCIFSAKIK